MNNRFNRWIHTWSFYHILFWVTIIISHAIDTLPATQYDIPHYVAHIIFRNGLLIGLTYLNLLWLIPRYAKKKKWLTYWMWLAAAVLVYILLINYFLFHHLYFFMRSSYERSWGYQAVSHFFTACRYLILSLLLSFIRDWFEQEKRMAQLRLDKISTELNFLRAQVNPHFLFNTLNNLYGLALKKSDKTPEIIMRLSDMMDYMLYESSDAKLPLQKDIDNLVNYVEIERIRQGNNAQINFSVQGKTGDLKIIPLLMLPLLENGFKHGVNKEAVNAWLQASVDVERDALRFTVVNNKPALSVRGEPGHGIGLENLKKRLELHYPGKYELLIQEQTDRFLASLNIFLS